MTHTPTLALVGTAVTLAGLAALLLAEKRESALGKWCTKPLASLGFVAVAHARTPATGSFATAMIVGLWLCLLGDVLLIPRSKKSFLAGLLTFLAGHVAYTVAFVSRGMQPMAMGLAAVVVALAVVVAGRWILASVNAKQPRMRVPVMAYMAVISVMVLCAVGTHAALPLWGLPVGAVLFYVSDLFVARNRFVDPGFVNRLFGLPLYYAAQLILAWSI